jgi:hypothetical protein
MSESLASLQCGFQDYVLGCDERALARVESTPGLTARRRLDIYHNAYRARLAELLADTYERVVPYVGETAFDEAARRFIEANPPAVRNLRNYGGTFPCFLADFFPDDPEIAELAEMDGRLRNTFDAADAATLGVADIATIEADKWDAVILELHPSASVQRFAWNTPAIWQSLSQEIAPPPAERLLPPVAWLFWRKDLQPHFRSLSAAEHAVLRGIGEGISFGGLCTELAENYPEIDVARQVGEWLRLWLDDGVLNKTLG